MAAHGAAPTLDAADAMSSHPYPASQQVTTRGAASRLPTHAEAAGEAPAGVSAAVGRGVMHVGVFDGQHPLELMAVEITVQPEVIFLITVAASGRDPTLVTNRVNAVGKLALQIGVAEDQLPVLVEVIDRLELDPLQVGLGAIAFRGGEVDIQHPRTLGELAAQ